MTSEQVLNVQHWMDLVIKGSIAVGISVAGFHIKRVGDDIDQIKKEVGQHQSDIMVLQSRHTTLDARLERIENKLDGIIAAVKK